MIWAITMLVTMAAAPLANGNQASQSPPEPDKPVITCETKNPKLPASTSIQFEANGVDLSEWLAKFKGQVQRNLFVPYRALTHDGCAIVSFHVSKDGSIDTPVMENPSATEMFNLGARNAILGATPTHRLPEEYQGEPLKFTVTFFFIRYDGQSPFGDPTKPTDPPK
jgi:outer membrane biosynthesis protein TonB